MPANHPCSTRRPWRAQPPTSRQHGGTPPQYRSTARSTGPPRAASQPPVKLRHKTRAALGARAAATGRTHDPRGAPTGLGQWGLDDPRMPPSNSPGDSTTHGGTATLSVSPRSHNAAPDHPPTPASDKSPLSCGHSCGRNHPSDTQLDARHRHRHTQAHTCHGPAAGARGDSLFSLADPPERASAHPCASARPCGKPAPRPAPRLRRRTERLVRPHSAPGPGRRAALDHHLGRGRGRLRMGQSDAPNGRGAVDHPMQGRRRLRGGRRPHVIRGPRARGRLQASERALRARLGHQARVAVEARATPRSRQGELQLRRLREGI